MHPQWIFYTDKKKEKKKKGRLHKKSSKRVAKQNGIEWYFMHMENVLFSHILALLKGQFWFPRLRKMTTSATSFALLRKARSAKRM